MILGFVNPVSSSPDVLGDSENVFTDIAATGQIARAVQTGIPGITPEFDPGVPAEVRVAVNDVLAQFEAVFRFPAGSVQIAVGWSDQVSLGVGGPVIVYRQGRYYPAAVADVRFGGHHARDRVDGFVSMGSNHKWYFGTSDQVPANLFDFRSAFAHELVHALGFTVHTEINARGQRVLSGRTQVLDQNLYSDGKRLDSLSPAQQSAAFGRDDVWFDVGGGRLLPLNSDGGRGVSHFGNAHSATDTEPGALMYSGLINGVRHSLDAPVIGALARLGFETIAGPASPVNVRLSGRTLRWNTDPTLTAPPAETIRINAYDKGEVIYTMDLPGAVEQHAIPAAAKSAGIEILLIDRSGNSTRAPVPGAAPAMPEATSLTQFVAAPDYRAEYGDVLRLYWAFFNREPDVGGASYWVGVYRSGGSLDAIAEAFASSPEFNTRYGSLKGNDDYLSVIYQNVLGRERDDAGFLYWVDLLNKRLLSRGAVVRWIAAAGEFIASHPY